MSVQLPLYVFLGWAVTGSPGGPYFVTDIVFIWAGTLRFADWLSAMHRRKHEKEEGYTYSYFIGWPRLLPANRRASYWQQAVLVILAGLILLYWDFVGGCFLTVAGISLLARLYVIYARRREDAMDALDAEWLAGDRNLSRTDAGGADVQGLAEQTAQVVSTADMVRFYSTR